MKDGNIGQRTRQSNTAGIGVTGPVLETNEDEFLLDTIIRRFFDFLHATSDKHLKCELIKYLASIITGGLTSPGDLKSSTPELKDGDLIQHFESIRPDQFRSPDLEKAEPRESVKTEVQEKVESTADKSEKENSKT